MLKSIGVVIGSYVLSVVLVLATDPLVSLIFPGDFVRTRVPSNPALLTSTAFFVLVSILCAWVCARFAPRNPGKHVFWFFVLGELMGIGFAIPGWKNGWPHWYSLSWLLSWPISCWIGNSLVRRDASSSQAAAVGHS